MEAGAGQLLRPPSPDERWPRPSWPRATARVLGAAAVALAVHAVLVVGTGWLDRLREAPAVVEQATPVEVVEEVPAERAPEKQPDTDPPAPAQSPPPPSDAPAQAAAAPAPPPAPHGSGPAPAAAPEAPMEVAVSHGTVEGAPTANPSDAKREDAASPEGGGAQTAEAQPPSVTERDAATAAHPFVPPTFRGAALPGATVQTQESYKGLVFGMLERAKRLPARTPTRRGVMAAYVRFMLDRAGHLVSLSLIGSTGDAELDAEALALVRRAAPFPKPPPEGTLLTFTPVILFGYDE